MLPRDDLTRRPRILSRAWLIAPDGKLCMSPRRQNAIRAIHLGTGERPLSNSPLRPGNLNGTNNLYWQDRIARYASHVYPAGLRPTRVAGFKRGRRGKHRAISEGLSLVSYLYYAT